MEESDYVPPRQQEMEFDIEIQKKINGIEMGIMTNGIPYLTQAGLADIAGINKKSISNISNQWVESYRDQVFDKDRKSFIREYLFRNNFIDDELYSVVKENKEGTKVHYAFCPIVCMAILEYYSFESINRNETAISNYRKFAGIGLITYIYESLKYIPQDHWKYFHDRMTLLDDQAPEGYFILFNETSSIVHDLIRANFTVNDQTIPDLSIGKAWAIYWKNENLAEKYRERIRFEHYYPEYYRQAKSNPQHPWAYPDEVLVIFRHWLKNEYLPTKFPKYILTKANILPGGEDEAKRIAAMYDKPRLKKGN